MELILTYKGITLEKDQDNWRIEEGRVCYGVWSGTEFDVERADKYGLYLTIEEARIALSQAGGEAEILDNFEIQLSYQMLNNTHGALIKQGNVTIFEVDEDPLRAMTQAVAKQLHSKRFTVKPEGHSALEWAEYKRKTDYFFQVADGTYKILININ